MVAGSLLVTGREYFGNPIHCMPPGEEMMQDMVDAHCWIHSTYTLPGSVGKQVGNEVAYPGVENSAAATRTSSSGSPIKNKVYQKYYQWVCFVLFFQGVFFYLPRYVWKSLESGRMKSLTRSLSSPLMPPEEKKAEVQLLSSYIIASLRKNDYYFYNYLTCEIMNLVNVLGQIYFMDAFLGGEFSSFGLDVLKHTQKDQDERDDPMIRVFPRMAKCIFRYFGSSGDVQKIDTICLLPQNVLNEKIYIFLWFWFMFMAIISSLVLVYRAASVMFVRVRLYVTSKRARMTDAHVLRCVIHSVGVSDWFLLHQISKNMDPINYNDLLIEVARSIKSERSGNGKALLANKPNIESALGDTSIAYSDPL